MDPLRFNGLVEYVIEKEEGPELKTNAVFQKWNPSTAEPISKPVTQIKSQYPDTPKKPLKYKLHDVTITDDYHWLEKGDHPEVKEWEEKQAKVTQSYLKSTKLQPLIDHYVPLMLNDYYSPPQQVQEGTRSFSFKRRAHQDQSVCFMHIEGKESELINPNYWGGKSVDFWGASRDGKYFALGISSGGSEDTRIQIFDTDAKVFLSDTCKGWRHQDVSWCSNNEGFYYSSNPLKGEVTEGEEKYWLSVYYHKLGTSAEQDVKVFSTDEKKDWNTATVSEDGRYVIFNRSKIAKNELYFKKVNSDQIIPIAEGFDAQYSAEIIEDQILITTDLGASMSQVYKTSVDKPLRKDWKLLIPEDPAFKIEEVVPSNKKLCVIGMRNACSAVKIYNFNGVLLREMHLPTHGTAHVKGYWNKQTCRVRFESFLHPDEIFTYDFESNRLTSIYQKILQVDVSKFTLDQVWFTSKDGTKVSMFVMHRKDIKFDGNNPAIIAGYGGFDIPVTPTFLTPVIPWIEAGGVCALPNLRGGGEYGQKWHEAGMGVNKQNVFDDFIAASEWLITNKLTNSSRLASYGGSNGGLLVAAAMVQRPELYRAVFCAVPLLDMLRYEEFDFAKIWNEEYGSVKDSKVFSALKNYSPYHHVENNVSYPSIMITAAENDSRVNPAHARKMVARLQAANPHGKPILYYLEKNAGHTGSPSMYDSLKQQLQPLAFLLAELSMDVPGETITNRVKIYSSIAEVFFKNFITEPVKGWFNTESKPQ